MFIVLVSISSSIRVQKENDDNDEDDDDDDDDDDDGDKLYVVVVVRCTPIQHRNVSSAVKTMTTTKTVSDPVDSTYCCLVTTSS